MNWKNWALTHKPSPITDTALAILFVVSLLLMAACGKGDATTPTAPTRQDRVQAYLTQHGLPTIAADKWDKYEGVAYETCANADDSDMFLAILAREVDSGGIPSEYVRAGIQVYCPEHLSDWDRATN